VFCCHVLLSKSKLPNAKFSNYAWTVLAGYFISFFTEQLQIAIIRLLMFVVVFFLAWVSGHYLYSLYVVQSVIRSSATSWWFASWSISEDSEISSEKSGDRGTWTCDLQLQHLQARLTSAVLLSLSPVLKWHGQYQGICTIHATTEMLWLLFTFLFKIE
jgi:hypothetical protein